ncbi:MAG: HEAT repeat domain-containing protein, partial [bacterium]|nr:HEAT repeat domain-containing protein [bacterium]
RTAIEDKEVKWQMDFYGTSKVCVREMVSYRERGANLAIVKLNNKDAGADLKWFSAMLLFYNYDKRAFAPLRAALKSKNSPVCANAVLAISKSRDRAAIPPILEALKNKNTRVVEAAVWALQMLNDSFDDYRAVGPLIEAI